LRADIFLDNLPSRSDGTVETSWGPQATFAPFLQMREAFPDKPTAPPFNDLGDVTDGVSRRILDEQMDSSGTDLDSFTNAHHDLHLLVRVKET